MTEVTLALEDPATDDVVDLLRASDTFAAALYPAESNHMLDVDALRRRNVSFFVARLNERAVGCGALVSEGGYGEIKRMFVSDGARGHGIGARLLAAMELRARQLGLTTLRLETGIAQPAALGLYRREGYRETGPFGAYGPDPLSVFMEKTLAP